jgi:pimeloyl-ACP methyl ester carboxylesterase
MKCASETWAILASDRTSRGSVYVRSIASRARSIRRFESSTARLTQRLQHGPADGDETIGDGGALATSVAIVFATSGNAQIAYDDFGVESGGTNVLLIHAGVTDRRSWASVIDRLSPGHRCVAYDGRGFGDTTYQPQPGWSPADDAVAVMDGAGFDTAVLVACSMGGAAALDVALDHPDRVSGLALIGTAVRGAPFPENEGPTADLEALIEAAEEAQDFDEVNRLEAWMWLDGPIVPEGRVGGPIRELFLEMNGRALRSPDPGSRAERPDAWPRLGEIKVPTLIMIGTLDVPDIQAVDEQLPRLIADSRLVRLDGVAHLPQLEADPACLAEISRFVDEVARR